MSLARPKSVEFSLDTPAALFVGPGVYVLKGWCFARRPADDLVIFVRAGGVETQGFIGLARPDVAEHFQNSSISECGFVVRFRCPPEVRLVSLMALVNGAELLLMDGIPTSTVAREEPARKANTYRDWLWLNEPGLYWPEEEIDRQLQCLPHLPLISIILPTYKTPRYFLQRCIESVMEQRYTKWQLCITDDGSCDEVLHADLKKFAQQDSRIRVNLPAQQNGISAASNCSLAIAEGSFIVLLDHDDELHSYALLELARWINEFPEADLFYSDEDKIDELGIRSQPSFKPDFDKDIFLSFNYLGHMVGLRRSLVNSLGGFERACDGAQDWDLLLRMMEVTHPSRMKHIPKPLYHWRMHGDSTSVDLDAKPYAAKAWPRVLNGYVQRTNKSATIAEGLFYGSMRVKFPAPAQVQVGVFLRPEDGIFQGSILKAVAGRRVVHLYHSIDCSVFQTHACDFTYSPDPIAPSFCSLTEISDDVFIFINGTLECVSHLFFEELLAQAMRDDCGLVTGISLDTRNRILATGFLRAPRGCEAGKLVDPYAGARYPKHGYMGMLNVVRSIDACPEAFFAVRSDHLAEIGGLGIFGSSDANSLLHSLSEYARDNGLLILSTPYAVATFSDISKPSAITEDAADKSSGYSRLSPHVFSFENPSHYLQGDVE